MTVIRPNSIAGITSLSALGTTIDFYNVNGTSMAFNNVNLNNTSGISTFNNINASGIGTFSNGPVFIGAATSTGTASQRLQVTGGAYVSGNLGIGTTRPTTKLDVLGIGQFLSNGATLNLVGTDHSYIQWYPDGIAAGRKAYTGYPGSSNNYFTITNEISDGTGHINLDPGTNAAVLIKTTSATGTASQNLQVIGGAYVSGNLGIGSTNPSSTLSVGGTITELSQGQYWNVVTQADVGIGASQIPLNQHLGQLAFLDEYGNNIPQNAQTAAYTLVRADTGKHISITTGGVTVPASVFEIGDAVTIYNNSTSNQTITQGSSVTLRLVGTATTGNRTLAQYGLCTVLCVASNTFVISGVGIS